MATDYGGQPAHGAPAWQGGEPGSGSQPSPGEQPGYTGQPAYADQPGYADQPAYADQPGYGGPPGHGGHRRRRGRARRGHTVAVAVLLLGIVGLGVSLVTGATQLLPRRFTAHQQQQIENWEVASRWRDYPAGKIFPASVKYPPPPMIGGNMLTAHRIGIARQASCRAATDAAVAVVLKRNGCQAVLRATYADATDSYVVTVGVATFSAAAQAAAAHRELAGPALARTGLGIRTVKFANTPETWFANSGRQISVNQNAGTYVVFYTVGYADNRPPQAIGTDRYTDQEMSVLGAGVAQAVMSVLGAPAPPPHCPGTPGC